MNQGNREFGASREMISCTFFPINDMPLFDVGGSNGNRSRKSIDLSSSSTVAFQHYANVEEDDLESFLDDRNDMPPTRESSPEPVWQSAKKYEDHEFEFGASREMVPCTFFPINDMPLFDVGGSNGNRSRKPIDMSSSSTVAFQHCANVEEDALESFLDNHNDMPPTREPSPEPVWQSAKTYEWKQEYLAERIQSHGQYLAPEPSVKPLRNNASDCGGGLSLVSLWTDESVARASQARGGHLPMAVTSGSSPKNDELMNFQ